MTFPLHIRSVVINSLYEKLCFEAFRPLNFIFGMVLVGLFKAQLKGLFAYVESCMKKSINNKDDLILIEKIAQRDSQAFEKLYFDYHERLFRFIWRFNTDDSIIEEVLNDTMMTIWQKAETFAARSKVSTWIFGIAYRKAMEVTRFHKKNQAESLDFDIQDDHEVLNIDIQSEWIRNALNDLSYEQKTVIELTYFNDFSYQQISEVMQCPVGTVKTRMFHARKSLKLRLTA